MTSFQGKLRIRHLEIVLMVAECGNLTRAANQLHLSQSGLSRAIAEIEEIVGGRVFERTPKGMGCTTMGLALCRHATKLLGEFRKAEADLSAIARGDVGNITIGCFSMFSSWPLAKAVRLFKNDHPLVTLDIQTGTHERLLRDLDLGEIDLLVSRRAPGLDPNAYRWVDLLSDHIVLVCSPRHPLLKRQARLHDCAEFPWITPLSHSRLHAELGSMLEKSAVKLPDMVGALAPEFGFEMLRDNRHLFLMPQSVAAKMESYGLLTIVPVDLHLSRSPLAAIWRANQSSPRELHAFADALKQAVDSESQGEHG